MWINPALHFPLVSEERPEGKGPVDAACGDRARAQAHPPEVHADGVGAQERVVQGPEKLLVVVLVYTG